MKVIGRPRWHKNVASWSLLMHMGQGYHHELLKITDAFIGWGVGGLGTCSFKRLDFREGAVYISRRKIQNKNKNEKFCIV